MARPRKAPGTIVVEIDGELIASTGGILKTENPETERIIRQEARLRTPVEVTVFGPVVEASLDPSDPLGNLAAMMSPRPGRARILEVPATLLPHLPDFFTEEDEEEVEEDEPQTETLQEDTKD